MRIPFALSRLRTVIMASLTFLILSAMLLIHVVTAKLTQRDLIDARIESGRLLLEAINRLAANYQIHGKQAAGNGFNEEAFRKNVLSLLKVSGFSGIMFKDQKGLTVFSEGDWKGVKGFPRNPILHAGRSVSIDFSGKTWGLFWRAPERIVLAAPLLFKGNFEGLITVFYDLKRMYRELRGAEPVILAYIAMNAIILVLFGIYLLSKMVVNPINRLVAITERFDGGIPALAQGKSPNNEIGRLSNSLNRMLRRLDANERKLKENISTLESANREIRRAQDEMVASEKMASVGRLATGVAHEIGNPLGIMLGYIELLQREDLTGSERKDFLRRMEKETRRIHRIIRDLLDFSRPSGNEKEWADAHEVLEEVLTVVKPQPLFEKIAVQKILEAKTSDVKLAPDLLKQVFLNLLINAADAMAHEGERDSMGAAPLLTIESLTHGGFLIMRFRDTGCGINPDDLKRIFDPFFTTKAPGKGTGLGLAICYTVMDRTGGRIRVENAPEQGTVVTIEMPLDNHGNKEKP